MRSLMQNIDRSIVCSIVCFCSSRSSLLLVICFVGGGGVAFTCNNIFPVAWLVEKCTESENVNVCGQTGIRQILVKMKLHVLKVLSFWTNKPLNWFLETRSPKLREWHISNGSDAMPIISIFFSLHCLFQQNFVFVFILLLLLLL